MPLSGRKPYIRLIQREPVISTRRSFATVSLSFLLLASGVGLAAASDGPAAAWPQFRGAGGLAVAADQRIPDEFGPDRNVLWKCEVPHGHSSPVVWGDHILLTGSKGSTLSVICFERSDGSELWQKDFEMKGTEEVSHKDSDPAAPTPCTDGARVHVYFGAYGLITLDMKGEVLWERPFAIEDNMFGTGTSPILHGGSLFLVRDVAGISALHCIDAATGEDRWVTVRPEAQANYGSPFVWKNAEREELIVAGSGVLKSYDLAEGNPLWWVNGVTSFVCTTPTASADALYFAGWSTGNTTSESRLATGFDHTSGIPEEVFGDVDRFIAYLDKDEDGILQPDEIPSSRAKDAFGFLDFNKNGVWEKEEIQGFLSFPVAPGRNNVIGVRAGGEGDVTKSHVLFEKRRGVPYVASPLLYKDRLYYAKKGGLLSCIDPETGKPHYETERLGVGGEYYSSPIGVGDRVFIGTVRGTMFVLGTGSELEIVAANEFDEGIFATPAVIDNTMYLRTTGHLYAIGEQE